MQEETASDDAQTGRDILASDDTQSTPAVDTSTDADSFDEEGDGSGQLSADVAPQDADTTGVVPVADGSGSPDDVESDADSSDVSNETDTSVDADSSTDTVADADAIPDIVDTGDGTCARPVIAALGSVSAIPTVDEQSPSCLSIDENEAVFAFTPPAPGTYCVDSRTSEAFDTLVSVRTVCGNVDTELVCYDDITEPRVLLQGFGTFTAAGTEQVFVLVDTYSYRPGQSVTLTISEGSCPRSVTDPGGDNPDLGEASCVDAIVDVADDFVPGDSFLIRCPAGCIGRDFIYGTDIYTDDSWICGASIHAGAITDAGGQVRVTIAAGQATYVGSTRNGVETNDWNSGWSRSFTVAAP
jgi:hypothetical protein